MSMNIIDVKIPKKPFILPLRLCSLVIFFMHVLNINTLSQKPNDHFFIKSLSLQIFTEHRFKWGFSAN